MFAGKLLLLSALGVAGLAYYLYVPFPDSARHPRAQTLDSAIYRFFHIYSRVGEMLGLGSEPKLRRTVGTLLASLQHTADYDNLEISNTKLDGVDVMILKPLGTGSGLLPGLVYFHGGGWTEGDTDTYKPLTAALALEATAVVISVKRAPEFPFPIPFAECLKVVRYVLGQGGQVGVDGGRVGLAGDEAGGNLALAVSLYLASLQEESDLPAIKVQGLFYPALQAFDFNLPSYLKHGDGPAKLSKERMVNNWLYYMLGDKSRSSEFMINNHTSAELKTSRKANYVAIDILPRSFQNFISELPDLEAGNATLSKEIEDVLLDPRFSPLFASEANLSRSPPTYIISCEFDVLRDDSFMLYERLRHFLSRRTITQRYYRTEQNGFLNALDETAVNALKDFVAFYSKMLNSA